jgi:hypothetical protein
LPAPKTKVRPRGGAGKKAADVDGIGGVVGALINHLEHIARADDGRSDLNAARAPAVGQRHFARAKRYLVARNRHRLEQCPADHALGLFV